MGKSADSNLARIPAIVDAQRAFALEGAAKAAAFRRERLRRLDAVLRANERRLAEALHADVLKSGFETYLTELGLVYHEIAEAIRR